MALAARITVAEPSSRRAAQRQRSWLSSSVSGGGAAGDAIIHNLSAEGALIELGGELQTGTVLAIELPTSRMIRARVAWRDGNLHGCRFDGILSEREIQEQLATSNIVWPEFGKGQTNAIPPDWASDAAAPPLAEDEQEGEHKLAPASRMRLLIAAGLITWALTLCLAWALGRALTA